MNYWYYSLNNEVIGPCPEESMIEAHRSGALTGETLVCREATEVWMTFNAAFQQDLLPDAPAPSEQEPIERGESNFSRLRNAAYDETKRQVKLGKLAADIARFERIDLAKAYQEVGRKAFEARLAEELYHDAYLAIEETKDRLESAVTRDEGSDGSKALKWLKAGVSSAKRGAARIADEAALSNLFADLGKRIATDERFVVDEELLNKVRSVESKIQAINEERELISRDDSSRTEAAMLSKAITSRTADQIHKASESIAEIVTGTPVDNRGGMVAATVPRQIEIGNRIVLGRSDDCDVVIPDRDVSHKHVEIIKTESGYRVNDLNSTIGTFLNGERIAAVSPFGEGDLVRVGSFTFKLDGGMLLAKSDKRDARISVHNLTKTVISRDTKKPLNLLDDVSLVMDPNEFVALLGPSGSGKSTFMDAINGRRPATGGRVMINDDDFYRSYEYYRRAIGYVPQQDIVHRTLTVSQALRFSARLRLPTDTTKAEIEQIIDDIIAKLGLSEKRHTLISHLSGGQLKRVSLGVELISDPDILFLDEATSGLDAGTEAKMMALFREIADDGSTVVCITHNVENVGLCDLVVLLSAGKIVYLGPPGEMAGYFGVEKISDVYDHLETASTDDWARAYQDSDHHRRYVANRLERLDQGAPATPPRRKGTSQSTEKGEAWRQLNVLRQRYTVATFRDFKNVAILLAQAPIIALLISLVFSSNEGGRSEMLILFLMVVSAIWFGCTNAAKEVVKELPIYLRERAINLKISAYLGSKMVVLSVLCFLQCVTLVGITVPMTGVETGMVTIFPLIFLTSIAGMMMGLLVSTLVDNTDKATAIVPILLIPQVIFSGAITPLSGFALVIARCFIVSFWAYDAALHTLDSPRVSTLQAASFDVLAIIFFIFAFGGLSFFFLLRKDVRTKRGK